MKILVDSNILLRLAHPRDPQHQLTLDATKKVLGRADELCIVPQNCYEFWVAATRPKNVNGLGLSPTEVLSELARLKRLLVFLDETPAFYPEWDRLVNLHAIIGKNAHDTRLVAAMTVHGITHRLTFNKQNFQRFTHITVFTPTDVMAMP
jgi:predicted nucleic acid-binding protein